MFKMLVFQQHFDLSANAVGKNLTECLLHPNVLYLAFLVGYEMIRQPSQKKHFQSPNVG